MPIDGRKLTPRDAIYTFVDNDGTNVHIHAGRLRDSCLIRQPEIFYVPVHHERAKDFLLRNIVSQARCLELLGRPKLDPVIFCKDGKYTDGKPDVMLVDGHHRYVLAHMMRMSVIEAHVLEQRDWRPFRIINLPDYTQEQLEATPILKRSY